MEYQFPNLHIQVHAPPLDASKELLTPDALRFVGWMCHSFHERRQNLLSARKQRAKEFDSGETPKFLNIPAVQDPHWRCAPIPLDVQDRRVEITGPVDRKMVINGLNSGASVYMADFEDSTSPTWKNLMEGQLNLRDAVQGNISYTSPCTGKHYALKKDTSVLFVRPRGWHLDEAHMTVNGKLASGSIFDFALHMFHNANRLIAKGTRPYFYLPKLESHLEARLWNDVFVMAQQYLGLPIGTIRATVLLETITASFEMEEILFELRDHSLGLNCGRWDYIFSYIKKFKLHSDKVAPDRSCLTMTSPLMEAYCKRVIYICHKRGTFAIGGMSAIIPRKDEKNDMALKRVATDKEREVILGHDGTWVAHPALVKCARDIFDRHMFSSNQIQSKPMLNGANISEDDLLQLPQVPYGEAITSKGLICGVKIVLHYTEAWLRGVGCIPLNNKMEDAATAEISRAQIWQWRHFGIKTQDDGVVVTSHRLSNLVDEEVQKQSKGRWKLAGKLVKEMLLQEDGLDDFLTTVCYPYIVTSHCEEQRSRL